MGWTGGCLCGAVRYRADEAPDYASYCHCDMCRKASGAPFSAFVQFREGSVAWIEDEPVVYVSSKGARRRFCGYCGSSLTFEAEGILFLTLGSLDRPDQVTFHRHTYTRSRLPGMDIVDGLPTSPGPAGGKGGR